MSRFVLTAAALLAAAASAEDGVLVTGVGETLSPPDRLEMAVTIKGAGEMAGDAVTKYRGQRDRFIEAVGVLGVEGLTTRPGTVTVSQVSPGGGNNRVVVNGVVQNQSAAANYTISETVTIDMPAGEDSLETASRLYDLGRDLGVAFTSPGGGTLVKARYTDEAEAQKKATAAAMEDARQKAARVAELAGRDLGPVQSVEVETASSRPTSTGGYYNGRYVPPGQPVPETPGAGGGLFTRQKTTATLKVRFAFAD